MRIGCSPYVSLQRLQAFLGLVYERCAGLAVEVEHLPTAHQLPRLRDGDLDLGLIHDMGPVLGIEAEPLYRGDALAAVVSLTHRVAACRRARLEDLTGDVLLVVPRRADPGLHDRVVALTARAGTRFRAIREAPGPDVRDLLFAVASGDGVTIAPRSTLRLVGDLGEAVAAAGLGPPSLMPDTCLVWPANARPEHRDVHAVARAIARQLYRS